MKRERKVKLWTRAQAAAAILAILLAAPFCSARARAAEGSKTTSAKTTTKSANLVDVNHATLEELTALPGIQDVYAAKIIKHRPYANKTQLSSQGVIPAATYRKIRALIIARQ
jgi:competence protein ComEA